MSASRLLAGAGRLLEGSGGVGGAGPQGTAGVDGARLKFQDFTATPGQIEFVLSETPDAAAPLFLSFNQGFFDEQGGFLLLAGATVTWQDDPFAFLSGDLIRIYYSLPAAAGAGLSIQYDHWSASSIVFLATQFLEQGGVFANAAGRHFMEDATLRGFSVFFDIAPNAARQYTLECVRDPTGTPIVLGSLICPNDGVTRFARSGALSAALNLADANGEYGFRLRRTTGVGSSDFSKIAVSAKWEVGP